MAVWLSRNEGNGGEWNGMEWETKKNQKKIKSKLTGFKSSWSSPTNQAFRTSLALTADGLREDPDGIFGFLDFWIYIFFRGARALCVCVLELCLRVYATDFRRAPPTPWILRASLLAWNT
jgi:hypothetical protein